MIKVGVRISWKNLRRGSVVSAHRLILGVVRNALSQTEKSGLNYNKEDWDIVSVLG